MRRRRLLALGGLGLSAALAGCTGGAEEEPLDERPAENEVVDGVRTAVGELNTASADLATVEDADDPGEIELDRERLRDRVTRARDALTELDGHEAEGEYEDVLAAAAAYADVVEDLLEGTVSLLDAADPLDELEDALESEAFDRARSELEGVRPTVEDARERAEDADAAVGDLDDVLDEYGALRGEIADGVASLLELAVGSDELSLGYLELLDGRDLLDDGQDHYDAGAFDEAESAFSDARERFVAAGDHFETGEDDSGDALEGKFEAARCRSENLTVACDHFDAAVAASRDGDRSAARHERQQGEAALDRAGGC